jgi:DnaJ-class molecular chaperone
MACRCAAKENVMPEQEQKPTEQKPSQSQAAPMTPGDQVPPGTPGAGPNVCPTCGGTGRRAGGDCPTCEGSGMVTEVVGGGG